jgi:hypothetical protein
VSCAFACISKVNNHAILRSTSVPFGHKHGSRLDNFYSLEDTYYSDTVRVAHEPWPYGQVPLEGSTIQYLAEEFPA